MAAGDHQVLTDSTVRTAAGGTVVLPRGHVIITPQTSGDSVYSPERQTQQDIAKGEVERLVAKGAMRKS